MSVDSRKRIPEGAATGPRNRRASTPDAPLTLITGGAGFIGTNLADRLLSQGAPVLVLDDLSRAGVERNLAWLRACHPERLQAAGRAPGGAVYAAPS